MLEQQKSTSGTVCLVGPAICSSLGPWGSTLATFIHMEII
jgi:hypothetical protein